MGDWVVKMLILCRVYRNENRNKNWIFELKIGRFFVSVVGFGWMSWSDVLQDFFAGTLAEIM